MKVKDLIEVLSAMDQEAEAVIDSDHPADAGRLACVSGVRLIDTAICIEGHEWYGDQHNEALD